MTSKVDETRQVRRVDQPNESIVMLKKPQLEGVGTEEGFLDCVQEKLGGELVHPEEGQAAKSRAPSKCRSRSMASRSSPMRCSRGSSRARLPPMRRDCACCCSDPGVTERLQEIGVRYVVWLDGNTRKTDGGGSIACGAGPGGAGCIGVGWWEKESDYVASVWDMQNATEIGSVSTDVTGTSVLIGAMAPIPIITPVRSTACNRLSEQLRSFLEGGDMAVAGPASAAGSGAGSSGSR